MNGKKANHLRSLARQMTAGLPNVAYIKGSPPVVVRRLINNQTQTITTSGVPTRLDPKCTRAVYKKLKAER